MLFQKHMDSDYGDQLISHAETLFHFSNDYRGKYSDSIQDVDEFYR
jgi:hypothetical protein